MKEFLDSCVSFFSHGELFVIGMTSLPFVLGFVCYFFTRKEDVEPVTCSIGIEKEEINTLIKEEKKSVQPILPVRQKPASSWSLF